MQSLSDDDVRKRFLEKPCFELAVKGVFRSGRCYILSRAFQVFGPATGKARLPTVDRLTGGKFRDIYSLSTYGRRDFSVAGPMVWNSLPEDMRDPECSVDSYRQSLKTFLFSQY